MINPYDLLGVTIDTSKEEIKRIYYQLSLLTHPDKGGTKDDMIALKNAYDFVMREINNINRTITVDDLNDEFREFCKMQEESVPLFEDIYADAFNLDKFNNYFDEHNNLEKKSELLQGGYGDLMETSMTTLVTSSNLKYQDIKYQDIKYLEEGEIKNKFKAEIVEYMAPKEVETNQNLVDYSKTEPISDYSLNNGGLSMSDYKKAFIESSEWKDNIDNAKEGRLTSKVMEELLNKKMDERKEVVEIKKDYIWSYEGLIDIARKRVMNFFRINK